MKGVYVCVYKYIYRRFCLKNLRTSFFNETDFISGIDRHDYSARCVKILCKSKDQKSVTSAVCEHQTHLNMDALDQYCVTLEHSRKYSTAQRHCPLTWRPEPARALIVNI